jgi:membrane protein
MRHRGRNATSPGDIPKAGWRDIALRLKARLARDNISLIAPAVAFYAMLGIFPALISAISIYGLVASPSTIEAHLNDMASILPTEAHGLISEQLRAFASADTALGWGLALGLVGALWSASTGVQRLMDAVNIAYEERDNRGFIKQRAIALLLTIGFIVSTIVLLLVVAVIPGVLSTLGLGRIAEILLDWGRWPFAVLLVMGGLSVVYAVAPNRERPKWRWVTTGSIVATALWVAGSAGFSFYVSSFGSFNKTYGAVASVVVLLLWLLLSAYSILIGAELNAEMEAQTAKDSTTGDAKPMGQRGAVKADYLGATP